MPAEKERTLNDIVDRLRSIPNLVAVVLGGSYARGFARSESDIDIGLYYREASPFPVDRVRSIAESICIPGSTPTVTDFYGWGLWVNGGAWIETPTGEVDFLYKDLDQIETVIEEGCRGVWRHDFDQQPPFGFRSVVYFGETYICIPLHDPEGEITRLKQSVVSYPEALRERIVQDSLWGAEFSLWSCRKFADLADVYNATGCMTRVAQFLVHALFALNKEYFVSDKYANRLIDQFPSRPHDFTSRLANVLAAPGADTAGLKTSAELLTSLWLETIDLTAGRYKPRFQL
jgi:nucleotidyltransferase-like protein/uncharacterized protein DUF4037